MLGSVDQQSQSSANPLLAKIQRLFSRDLALENDYLRQENKILRRKLGSRVPLTEADRRILVKYGLRIKDRLGEVVSIAKPETLLAWHRRQKQQKWTFGNRAQAPGRPRKSEDAEALVLSAWQSKTVPGATTALAASSKSSGTVPAPAMSGRYSAGMGCRRRPSAGVHPGSNSCSRTWK